MGSATDASCDSESVALEAEREPLALRLRVKVNVLLVECFEHNAFKSNTSSGRRHYACAAAAAEPTSLPRVANRLARCSRSHRGAWPPGIIKH